MQLDIAQVATLLTAIGAFLGTWQAYRKSKVETEISISAAERQLREELRQEAAKRSEEIKALREEIEALREENTEMHIQMLRMRADNEALKAENQSLLRRIDACHMASCPLRAARGGNQ